MGVGAGAGNADVQRMGQSRLTVKRYQCCRRMAKNHFSGATTFLRDVAFGGHASGCALHQKQRHGAVEHRRNHKSIGMIAANHDAFCRIQRMFLLA